MKYQSKSVRDIKSGDRFGRLVVIEEIEPKILGKSKLRQFLCRCDCGNYKNVIGKYLVRGETSSCGKCNDVDFITSHRFYTRADRILSRCNNSNHMSYKNYGGRGIRCDLGNSARSVCLALEKVPGFFEGAQIDRIDNDGNYTLYHPIYGRKVWYDEKGRPCLGNLRWVTNRENMLNTSRSVTKESLELKPREYKDIIKICKNHDWNINDFDIIRLGRKRYILKPKCNDYSERK